MLLWLFRVVRKVARENAEGIHGTDKVALNGLVTVNPPAETCGMYPLVFLKFWLRPEIRCRTDCSTQRCFNGELMYAFKCFDIGVGGVVVMASSDSTT